MAKRHRAESLQCIKPVAPESVLRQFIKEFDERKSEISKMLQSFALPLYARQPRLIFTVQFLDLLFKLLIKAVQPAFPAIESANHSRIDKQALPILRYAQ